MEKVPNIYPLLTTSTSVTRSAMSMIGAEVTSGTRRSKLGATAASLNGERHTIFGVKKNPRFAASVRLGVKPPRGAAEYATAETYKGGWVDNKRGGFGTLTQSNGNKYEGEWSAGMRHGHGTQWVAGPGRALVKLYSGWWASNKREASGTRVRGHAASCVCVCVCLKRARTRRRATVCSTTRTGTGMRATGLPTSDRCGAVGGLLLLMGGRTRMCVCVCVCVCVGGV